MQYHKPRRIVPDAQILIKRNVIVNLRAGVQEYFRYPRHQDENEYENVIAFQAPPEGFQFADLEAGQNQIFANELFPFTVEHLAIFHHHGDKKMRFEHSNTRAKGIIETVTTRFDPYQYPDD